MNKNGLSVTLRGRAIGFDEDGLACLNDIWTAAGFTRNQRPHDWARLPGSLKLVEAVLAKVTGKSRNWTKSEIRSVYYTKTGVGSFADVRLALSYAEYLNPKLALEVREVFLRYKAADPTLADEVLERASSEANEWVATRALGRVKRNEFTASLQSHGVAGYGFGNCTNAVYESLFGKRKKALALERGLPANANLRDAMNSDELVSVMFAEMLSKQRLEDEDPHGNRECEDATRRSSLRVRSTIEDDRRDRQRRLVR